MLCNKNTWNFDLYMITSLIPPFSENRNFKYLVKILALCTLGQIEWLEVSIFPSSNAGDQLTWFKKRGNNINMQLFSIDGKSSSLISSITFMLYKVKLL